MNDRDTTGRNRSAFWRQPSAKWLLGIPLGGFVAFVAGAIGLGIFNWTLHSTSTTEFCFKCHSHENFIRPEYQASSHFRNNSGVTAGCADCHLPHGWFEYTWTKMVVSLDVIPELAGKIGTREKYEAHRAEMAKKVWVESRLDGSEYCHHCHDKAQMAVDDQGKMAQRRHRKAAEEGTPCIDCHQGIVHALPEDWETIWAEVEKETEGRVHLRKASLPAPAPEPAE
jgi:nitrate/TMAO reductase-like tetraheme cytochrome c subunit